MTKEELEKAFQEARKHAIEVSEMERDAAIRRIERLKKLKPTSDLWLQFGCEGTRPSTYAMGTLRMITDLIQGKYK